MTFSTFTSIIVVDDELELLSLFKTFLEKEGYITIAFTDPIVAQEYFKKNTHTKQLTILYC